eukprot:4328411-Amphidinium_carterae.1
MILDWDKLLGSSFGHSHLGQLCLVSGAFSPQHPLRNLVTGSTKVGKLVFEDAGMIRRYSFLDFVRGGLDLNILLGIDFT